MENLDCSAESEHSAVMRIAIVSDIHGNLTAFEAVLADLRQTSPDLILHGGDLADSGASPTEIVDQVRDLGWQGVVGNTDEMLFSPESLREFASQSPKLQSLFAAIGEMAAATREALGEERLAWLRGLPLMQMHGPMAVVHASPESPWRAPAHTASDTELESVYAPLGRPIAIYAHIHRSYIRNVAGMMVANTGSVSLSYDGDRRAAYLLLDDFTPAIRRVEYDVDKEIKALSGCTLPHADWVAKMLDSGGFQMP
jgi:putative phosphoesterase